MSIDNVQLYSNASVIIYDYYPYGTLLVSCIMDIFKWMDKLEWKNA